MDNNLTQEVYSMSDYDIIKERHDLFIQNCENVITNENQIDTRKEYQSTPSQLTIAFIAEYLKVHFAFLGFDQDTVKKYLRYHSLSSFEIEEVLEDLEDVGNSVEPIVEEAPQDIILSNGTHEYIRPEGVVDLENDLEDDLERQIEDKHSETFNKSLQQDLQTSSLQISLQESQEEDPSRLHENLQASSLQASSLQANNLPTSLQTSLQAGFQESLQVKPQDNCDPSHLSLSNGFHVPVSSPQAVVEMNGFFEDGVDDHEDNEEIIAEEEKNEFTQLPSFPKTESHFRTNQYMGSFVDEKDVKSVKDCISSIKKALSMSNIELNRKKAKILVFCKNKNIPLSEKDFDVIDSRGNLIFTEDDIDSIYEMIKSFEETNNTIHQMSVFMLRIILEVVERFALLCGITQLKGLAKNINPEKFPKSINRVTTLIGDNCSNNVLCMSEFLVEIFTYALQESFK